MRNLALAFIVSVSLSACSSCNDDKPVTEEEKKEFETIEELEVTDDAKSDSFLKAMQEKMGEVSDDSLVNNMPTE